MSISDTVGQAAATNPAVGVAVALASTNSAVLAGLQTGDTAMAGLLGAASSQALVANRLLSSLDPNLGRLVDLHA